MFLFKFVAEVSSIAPLQGMGGAGGLRASAREAGRTSAASVITLSPFFEDTRVWNERCVWSQLEGCSAVVVNDGVQAKLCSVYIKKHNNSSTKVLHD